MIQMKADGLDGCIIGCCMATGRLIYSEDKILGLLMQRDGMSLSEAMEFFEYNILGAWVGEGAPIFLTAYDKELWEAQWGGE